MAGLSGNINLVASGVQYALFIIFSSIMFFFVDKIGRRTLLIYGALAMAFCHFVVGGILGAHGVDVPGGVNGDANVLIQVTGSPAYTVIAFSYLLIIVYALTLAPVCWIYAAEVWSLETRATGMGIAAIGNWLVCLIAKAHLLIVLIHHSSMPPLVSSSLLPSATSSTVCSYSLEHSASLVRRSSSLPFPRHVARLLRKSRLSSVVEALMPGTLRKDRNACSMGLMTSPMLRRRAMPLPILKQSKPRRERNTRKGWTYKLQYQTAWAVGMI